HNLSCNFLKALILIIEAREETDPLEKVLRVNHDRNTHTKRKQKNHYTNIRNTIEHFRAHVANHPQLQQSYETTVPEKWQESYRALLSFDFEAAVFLSQWDCLPRIIEESSSFADSRLCAVFLDSILSAEAPVSEMVRVVMVHSLLPRSTDFQIQQGLTTTDNNKHPPHLPLPNPQQVLLRNLPPVLPPLPLPTIHPSKRNPPCRGHPR